MWSIIIVFSKRFVVLLASFSFRAISLWCAEFLYSLEVGENWLPANKKIWEFRREVKESKQLEEKHYDMNVNLLRERMREK